MKKSGNIALLVGLQCLVISLAFLAGWNHGLPADCERLRSLEVGQEQMRYFDRKDNNATVEMLQSVIELLQIKNDSTSAVDRINAAIDVRIVHHSGWTEFGCPRGLEWPGGEDQFRLILRIAEYRQAHPARQTYPSGPRHNEMPIILDEAMKCQIRRVSAHGWTPPQTTQIQVVEIIEPTNAPYSSSVPQVQRQ